MSSFKRRTPKTETVASLGTQQISSTPSISLLSTGILSLDDILGGGLSIGTVLTILTPDPHSAWGELLQRYFISEGLASGQNVLVIGDDTSNLVEGSMWLALDDASLVNEKPETAQSEKVKIAWRYETMKQFQTTVASGDTSVSCHSFDLTSRIPSAILSSARENGQLVTFDLGSITSGDIFATISNKIEGFIQRGASRSTNAEQRPLRICLPDLGSPAWGDFQPHELLRFLHSLRASIRSSTASVLVTHPPTLSSPRFGDAWIPKLGFLSDACITLSSFGDDPSLSAIFQNYSGLVTIQKVPSRHTLLPPSLRYSHLLGIASSSSRSSSTKVGGENNLAFKCTRKRFVIETLHLDVDGGTGERRTTAPSALASVEAVERKQNDPEAGPATRQLPRVSVEMTEGVELEAIPRPMTSKPKKRVAFNSERPDLYDF